jgi:hypothetical protein
MAHRQMPTRHTLTGREVARLVHSSKNTVYANVESFGGFRAGRRVVFPVGRVAQVLGITEEQLWEQVARNGNGNGR